MRAIKALDIVCREGLDNSRYAIQTNWGDIARCNNYFNPDMALAILGGGKVIFTYLYTPVDSVLLVWREEKEVVSEFYSDAEPPLVIVETSEGDVVEVYSLV